MIVDTHCHLYYEELVSNIENILAISKDNGLDYIIVPAVDIQTSESVIALADKYPMIYAVIGVHPCDIKDNEKTILDKIAIMLKHKKVIGIGETGLDFYWEKENIEKQKDFFRMQIRLAKEFNLPVIVHSRDSIKETIKIIKEEYNDKIYFQMHCFSGDLSDASELLEFNKIYFSFCGNITFKNYKGDDVVKSIPVERLLFETDSPFLSPVPFRGKTNFPYHIIHTIKKISEIKNIEENYLKSIVRENTKQIYGI